AISVAMLFGATAAFAQSRPGAQSTAGMAAATSTAPAAVVAPTLTATSTAASAASASPKPSASATTAITDAAATASTSAPEPPAPSWGERAAKVWSGAVGLVFDAWPSPLFEANFWNTTLAGLKVILPLLLAACLL